MSLDTWTPAALRSELGSYAGRAWRLVEAQHRVSTLKLVESLEEQAVLEDILETSKPRVPAECQHLDYLLATPFRYDSPYPHGSRFRRAGMTPGVWYGAETVETALAEMVFYRFLFFAESPETPWPVNPADYTAFSVGVTTAHALDLTISPLNTRADLWTDPRRYAACQDLADAAREAGGQLIRYQSVRDPEGRANLAVMSCGVFTETAPTARQTWRIRLGKSGAQALCDFPDARISFAPQAFDDPRVSDMRWDR